MAVNYPFLVEQRPNIRSAVAAEERRFGRTLEGGMARLDGLIGRLDRPGRRHAG